MSGDGVSSLILHLTDNACLSSFDHFENMKKGWFLPIQFVLGVSV